MKTQSLPAEVKRRVGFEVAALTAAALKYPERLESRRQAVVNSLTEGVGELPGWVGVAIFELCEEGGGWDYFAEGSVAFQPADDGGGARFAFLLDTLISGVGQLNSQSGGVESFLGVWKHSLDQAFPVD